MKKLVSCVLIGVLLSGWALLGTGCGTDRDDDRPRIALVMKSLANEFFKTMEDGAKAHQQEHSDRYNLIAVGIRDEQDDARQISDVELMIAQGVQAIVIAPADSQTLVSVSQRAQEAGIVVINIDNKLDEDVMAQRNVKIPFVGPDNRKGARLAGEYLAQHLSPGDQVAIIEGAPNAFNGIQRRLGFEDAIEAAGLNLVASQSGQWETDRANQVASAIITEHPEVKALLCANDSMALGAVAALRSAGKIGDILIVGFDNIQAVQQLILQGDILCTVDQYADQLAIFGIEYALSILEDGSAILEDKETAVDLVTADMLQ